MSAAFLPDREPDRHEQMPVSIQDYLHLGLTIKEDIENIQKSEERRGYTVDTATAFAKKLIQLGRENVKAVLKQFPDGTQPRDVKGPLADRVMAGAAAILFAASYIAIDDFIQSPEPGPFGSYLFDSNYFLSLYNEAVTGTGKDRQKEIFSVNTIPGGKEIIDDKMFKDLQSQSKFLGTANIFENSQWGKFPLSIVSLCDQQKVTEKIRFNIAEKFREHLKRVQAENTHQESAEPPQQETRRSVISGEEKAKLDSIFGDFDPFAGFE